MRKFWLKVGENLFLDLNLGAHIWTGSGTNSTAVALKNMLQLHNVSGLGFERQLGFEQTGAVGYIATLDRAAQTVVAGTLSFVPGTVTPYAGYKAFCELIEGAETSLFYSPEGGAYNDTEFSIASPKTAVLDGAITKITKSELRAGILSVGFEFRGYMPWYNTAAESRAATVSNNTVVTLNKGTSGIGRAFDITLTAATAVEYAAAVIKNANGAVVGGFELPGLALAKDDVLRWCSDPMRRCFMVNGVDKTRYTNLATRLYPLLPNNATLTFGMLASGTAMTGQLSFTAEYKAYRRSI